MIGLAVICLALSACGTSPEEEEPETVSQSLQELLNLDPTSPDQIRLMIASKRYQQALEGSQGILVTNPGDPEASLLMGEALLGLNRPFEALPFFEAAAATEAYRAEALQGAGIALYRSGRGEEAIGRLSEATSLNSGLWRAFNTLGTIYDKQQSWAQAESAFQSALAANPSSALLHNNLAMSYMLQRRYEEAIPKFKQALALDSSLKPAQTNLQMAYAFQGRYLEALAGVPENELPDALNNVGYAAMVRGDYDVAEAYFTRAMEISPAYNTVAAANLNKLRAIRVTENDEAVEHSGTLIQ
jgi:Flp pilus assembly protein TadD